MLGRPVKSLIRERMQQVVDALGASYGYEIFKVYREAFAPISVRSMYYHLNKGISIGEFEAIGEKKEKGIYTWGDLTMRKYYILGPSATEKADNDLHNVIKSLGLKYRPPNELVDWPQLLKEKTKALEDEMKSAGGAKNLSAEKSGQFEKRINDLIGWFGKRKIPAKELDSLNDLLRKTAES